MKRAPDTTFVPESASDAFLGLLAARGIDYFFANGGTDFAPIAESYARAEAYGWRLPTAVIAPHENLGVAMAHGHTMVSGRPQAMMVHVGVGTANLLNGAINASRQRVPILLCAGRTPLTEGGEGTGLPGARNNFIHWAQEHFDQGGMLREFVKWDYELRHPEQLETVVDRALAIAMSEPRGPVYLTLPRELLGAPARGAPGARPVQVPATPPAADPAALDEVASLVARAESPLLITADAGRSASAARALARLADEIAIPVVHYRPRYFALSTEHPMHAGWDPHALLPQADLVLVVDCDVPWIPVQGAPSPRARVVHIGPDPLYARYPLRGFRTDIALTGTVGATLEALRVRVHERSPHDPRRATRHAAIGARAAGARAAARSGVGSAPRALSGKWLSACLNSVLPADAIVVNEYPLVLEEMTIAEPGRYFAASPAGGLGWGLGAALGAKLAAPERTVVCTLGDGAYMFGNPTPGHFVSESMRLPVLFVIFNNARWAAVHRATLGMYPQGYAAKMSRPPIATLEPAPRFEKLVEASGGYGERVESAAEVVPALARALRAVRDEGRQALLNVCLEASYVKTS
jgi:acetolactate synthase-1/2/3 large subunit